MDSNSLNETVRKLFLSFPSWPKISPPPVVTLGKAGNTDVSIGDIERRSGLYMLGKPGMGKSSLLVNLAAQDIKHGHGIFFLDPHGDALLDLLRRGDTDALTQRAILL